jgi:hypothetical protein
MDDANTDLSPVITGRSTDMISKSSLVTALLDSVTTTILDAEAKPDAESPESPTSRKRHKPTASPSPPPVSPICPRKRLSDGTVRALLSTDTQNRTAPQAEDLDAALSEYGDAEIDDEMLMELADAEFGGIIPAPRTGHISSPNDQEAPALSSEAALQTESDYGDDDIDDDTLVELVGLPMEDTTLVGEHTLLNSSGFTKSLERVPGGLAAARAGLEDLPGGDFGLDFDQEAAELAAIEPSQMSQVSQSAVCSHAQFRGSHDTNTK